MRLSALVPVLVLAMSSASVAGESAYRLRIDSSQDGGKLTLTPYVEGPAGARLRYELKSDRQGAAGHSSTSQGGGVAVGNSGSAKLSTLSFSIAPQDRYTVTVRVFEGMKVVAEKSLIVPQ
jgi:hypothetical protein